ncbi:MAG: RNase H family protein, partial [Thermodesulfobacteriota bacterium]
MPHGKKGKKESLLLKRFLEDLQVTLDLKETAHKLHITEDAAGELLSVMGKELFGGACELVLYVDGASRGNPGEAGAGAVVKDKKGKTLKRLKRRLGTATNNEAEYQALLMALREA